MIDSLQHEARLFSGAAENHVLRVADQAGVEELANSEVLCGSPAVPLLGSARCLERIWNAGNDVRLDAVTGDFPYCLAGGIVEFQLAHAALRRQVKLLKGLAFLIFTKPNPGIGEVIVSARFGDVDRLAAKSGSARAHILADTAVEVDNHLVAVHADAPIPEFLRAIEHGWWNFDLSFAGHFQLLIGLQRRRRLLRRSAPPR